MIIILLQTIPFLGAEAASGGPIGAIRAWPDAIAGINFNALAIAAVTLAVGVCGRLSFENSFPQRWRHWRPGRSWVSCG